MGHGTVAWLVEVPGWSENDIFCYFLRRPECGGQGRWRTHQLGLLLPKLGEKSPGVALLGWVVQKNLGSQVECW